MKTILLRVALLSLIGLYPIVGYCATAANDLYLTQRNAGNTANVQNVVAPTASSALAFDSSKVPISTQALTLSSVTAPAGIDLTLAGGSSGASLVLGQGGSSSSLTKDHNTDTALYINNPNAGAIAQATLYVSNASNTGAAGAFVGVMGTSATTAGGFVQDSGQIGSGSLLAGGLSIMSRAASSPIRFYAGSYDSESARLTSTGNLLIGTTSDAASLAGGLVINGSGAGAAASSTTTGALRVTGGVGVSGAGYFGGDVSIIGAAALDRTLTIQSLGAQYAQLKMNTNSSTANNFQILAESGGRVYFQQNNGAINTLQIESTGNATYSKKWNISDTTSASSSTVGALTIGNGTAATNVAIGGGKVNIGDTTAGSAGAGALVVAGGISAAGASYFGGAVTAALSGGQAYVNVGGSPSSLPGAYSFVTVAAGNGAVTEYQRTNATARTWRTGVGINGADEFSIHDVTAGGAIAFSIAGATKAATFAGAVTTGALTVSSANLILSAGYELRFGAGGADRIYQSASSGGTLVFDTGSVTRFTLNSTAATFAGAVTAGGNVLISNPSSTAFSSFQAQNNNGVNATIQIGTSGSARGGTYFGSAEGNLSLIFANGTSSTGLGIGTFNANPLVLGTNNTAALTINATTQAATFAGAVTSTGTLTIGSGSGATLSAGSLNLGKDIGLAAGQGIVQGAARVLAFTGGDATFAGAVTAAVVTSTGAGYTNSGFQITNTSASRTTGLFLSNAGVTSIRDVTGAADLFTITTSGNATFAGAVTSTGTLTTSSGRVVATSIKTTTYTLATTDHVIVCNHASTPFTVTLIAASANTGRVFVVKNKGAATVTLSATSLGTIDGSNTRDLSTNQSLTLCSDGVQWNII